MTDRELANALGGRIISLLEQVESLQATAMEIRIQLPDGRRIEPELKKMAAQIALEPSSVQLRDVRFEMLSAVLEDTNRDNKLQALYEFFCLP